MSQFHAPGITLAAKQKTLRAPIHGAGVGLHSGARVTMVLRPAPVDHGIVFRRVDLPGTPLVRAEAGNVRDTTLCTALRGDSGAQVGTVEHIMAALAAAKIDNLLIDLDGPEVPIMDGSAAPFSFLIACAGVDEQDAERRYIQLLRPVSVRGQGRSVRLEPAAHFSLDARIVFDHPLIGTQTYGIDLDAQSFRTELARARTFGFADQIATLRENGLARGGSLDNAVVMSRDGILNPEGLRFEDEFVRHKVLDAVGDLYLAGAPLLARYVGECAGHAMHHKLLTKLLAQPSAWRYVDADGLPFTGEPVRAHQPSALEGLRLSA